MKKFKKTDRLSFDEKIASSNFDYCKNLKWFLIAPAVIILIGIILFFTVGFNLGMDFTGGSIMTIYANDESKIEGVKSYNISNSEDFNSMQKIINEILNENNLYASVYQTTTMTINELDVYDGQGIIVKYQNIDGASSSEIESLNQKVKEDLLKAFGYNDISNGNYAITNGGVTTATASNELLMNAFIAMLVALALILIYVAFRFELASGLATILALFHDLLIMASFVLIFRITINSSFIAALVTILGYSINNTIVIFDRIRENQKSGKYEKAPNSLIANNSVKETMTRSIFTTLTTFITIALVAIIGVTDIRDFAIPITIGVLAGFYSSVFITPGLWAIAYNHKNRKKIKKNNKPTNQEDKIIA